MVGCGWGLGVGWRGPQGLGQNAVNVTGTLIKPESRKNPGAVRVCVRARTRACVVKFVCKVCSCPPHLARPYTASCGTPQAIWRLRGVFTAAAAAAACAAAAAAAAAAGARADMVFLTLQIIE